MSYRDDLDAAHARIEALEAELAATKRAAAPEPLPAPPTPRPPKRLNERMYYHRPHSYIPLLLIWLVAVPIAFRRRPGLLRSKSDNVLAYFAHNYLARPFVIGVWAPIYCAALCVGLPIVGAGLAVLSIPLLPMVAIAGLSFSAEPPNNWLHEPPDEESTTLVFFVMMFGPQVAVFLPAMIEESDWKRR